MRESTSIQAAFTKMLTLSMTTPIRSLALSILLAAATVPALAEKNSPQREFADTMILCNAHALFMTMYAQGKPLPGVPKAADYKELAIKAAGKEYVGGLLEATVVRDTAMEQLKALLNAKPYEGLSEKERDDHMNATWTKIITSCNEFASAGASPASPKK